MGIVVGDAKRAFVLYPPPAGEAHWDTFQPPVYIYKLLVGAKLFRS